jgi:hypothetical protein
MKKQGAGLQLPAADSRFLSLPMHLAFVVYGRAPAVPVHDSRNCCTTSLASMQARSRLSLRIILWK